MEDAAEPVSSEDVKLIESAWFGEWLGGRPQRRAVQAPVGAVFVIEVFEFAQCVQQMVLVPDQGAVEELAPAGLYPPLHDRVHPWHPHPSEPHLDARLGQNGVEQLRELAVGVTDQPPCPGPCFL
jgi:hypothetical protein